MEPDHEDDYELTESPLTEIKRALAERIANGIPDVVIYDGTSGELLATSAQDD